MAEINLTLDRKDLARFRTLLSANRTMAAKSLTFTAEKAVPAWRAGHRVFHKRNSWIDKGVRMRPATPATLSAKVGTIDRYMGRHIPQLNQRKGGNLFVPAYGAISEAPTHTRMRSRLKQAKGTKRKPFRIGSAIFRRKGKARTPLILLGHLTRGAEIRPELNAVGIVDGVVRREFPRIYERLLLKWAQTGQG